MAHLFGDCDNPGDYDNGIYQHMLQIPRVPLEKKLSDYEIVRWLKFNDIDVLFCTMWDTFLAGTGKAMPGIELLKKELKDLKIIGVVDHPLKADFAMKAGSHVKSMEIAKGYIEALPLFDGILCLIEDEIPFYSSYNNNVCMMGLPFPFETYKRFIKSEPRPEKGDNIWVGLGVGGPAANRWDRNYITTLETFKMLKQKALQEKGKEYADRIKGVMLSFTEKDDRSIIQFFKDNYDDVFIQLRKEMPDYLHYLQSCDVVLNFSLRDTPGRLAGECAYFKVPMVGSCYVELQCELSSPTSVNPFDIYRGSSFALNILLKSEEERKSQIDGCFERLKAFDYENSIEKIKQVLEKAGLKIDEGWETVEEEQKVFL